MISKKPFPIIIFFSNMQVKEIWIISTFRKFHKKMCRCTIHLLRNLWIIRINLIINHSHAKSNDSSFNDKRPCRIDEIIAKTGLGQYIFIRIINSFIIIFLTKLVLRVHSTKHQLWFFVFKIGVMIERLKFSRNFGQELEVPIRT